MPADVYNRAFMTFASRLDTLSALLDRAGAGLDTAILMQARLAADMLPFPYQVVFACNQASDYVAWLEGRSHQAPDPSSLCWTMLTEYVDAVRAIFKQHGTAGYGGRVPDFKDLRLGPSLRAKLPAIEYLDDFLLPNFYFHLTTAYSLLRQAGLPIGKADFMAHLADRVVAV